MISWINKYRLYSQQLTNNPKFKTPQEILKWFCGMQAQDYPSAKFAIGVRLPGTTEADIDKAIADREIIRTWPMRGTLHFVTSEDIHWLFDLLAPRSKKAFKWRNQQLGLDDNLLNNCNDILIDVLQGGNLLTREELRIALADSGIKVDGVQLSHVLNNAALDKLICFGVMRGKQHTFTLLDEWVTESKSLNKEESVTELARRYFLSRGPATVQDFVWWSGLPLTEARGALSNLVKELTEIKIEGTNYWFKETEEKIKVKKTLLLPAFDEYLISYKDRTSMLDPLYKEKAVFINGIFNPIIVIDGVILGMWKRTVNKNDVLLKPDPFIKFSEVQMRTIKKETDKYGRFLNKNIKIEW